MKKKMIAPILAGLSVLMIVVMLIPMFQPFFETTIMVKGEDGKRKKEDVVISLNEYVWFPEKYNNLPDAYEDLTGWEFVINYEVTMPALVLVLGIALSIFALVKHQSIIGPLSALGLGAYSAYGFATSAFLQMGLNWQTNWYLSLATAIVGGICVALYFLPDVLKKLAEKKAAA